MYTRVITYCVIIWMVGMLSCTHRQVKGPTGKDQAKQYFSLVKKFRGRLLASKKNAPFMTAQLKRMSERAKKRRLYQLKEFMGDRSLASANQEARKRKTWLVGDEFQEELDFEELKVQFNMAFAAKLNDLSRGHLKGVCFYVQDPEKPVISSLDVFASGSLKKGRTVLALKDGKVQEDDMMWEWKVKQKGASVGEGFPSVAPLSLLFKNRNASDLHFLQKQHFATRNDPGVEIFRIKMAGKMVRGGIAVILEDLCTMPNGCVVKEQKLRYGDAQGYCLYVPKHAKLPEEQ